MPVRLRRDWPRRFHAGSGVELTLFGLTLFEAYASPRLLKLTIFGLTIQWRSKKLRIAVWY